MYIYIYIYIYYIYLTYTCWPTKLHQTKALLAQAHADSEEAAKEKTALSTQLQQHQDTEAQTAAGDVGLFCSNDSRSLLLLHMSISRPHSTCVQSCLHTKKKKPKKKK